MNQAGLRRILHEAPERQATGLTHDGNDVRQIGNPSRREGPHFEARYLTLFMPWRSWLCGFPLNSLPTRRDDASDVRQIEVFDPGCVMLPDHLRIDMAEHLSNILRPLAIA